jgi:hypothetical protein
MDKGLRRRHHWLGGGLGTQVMEFAVAHKPKLTGPGIAPAAL